MKLNPYLNFSGNATQAFQFYQTVFGGELSLKTMGEIEGIPNLREEEKEMAMHVSLPIGEGQYLMASDCLESQGHALKKGNSNYIALDVDSREDADRIFNGLSAGGNIEMPMEDQFWGDYFGSFCDKFGVYWMIIYSNKKEGAE